MKRGAADYRLKIKTILESESNHLFYIREHVFTLQSRSFAYWLLAIIDIRCLWKKQFSIFLEIILFGPFCLQINSAFSNIIHIFFYIFAVVWTTKTTKLIASWSFFFCEEWRTLGDEKKIQWVRCFLLFSSSPSLILTTTPKKELESQLNVYHVSPLNWSEG